MYKVFLVEDEIVIREGVRNNIPWDQTPYTLAGEAPDGEMALSMIQDIKPDILITDIRMPFMDGLTLSGIVKKNLPWIKIIILSGHDEFEYAKEAIGVGVDEYLLKPVSSQEMLKTLDKIAERINDEKEKLQNIEKLKAQLRSSADILRDRWLSDFLNGRISAANAIEQGKELGIDLLARSYIVLAAGIRFPPEREELFVQAKIIYQSILEKYPNSIWFSDNEKNFFALIREMSDNEEETAYTIAQALKYEIERKTECAAMIGIGPKARRIGEAAASYLTAKKIINYGINQGLSMIARDELLPHDETGFDPSPLLKIDGDMLFTRLKYAAKKDIDSLIQDYTKAIDKNFDENHMLIFFTFGEIIIAASRIVEAFGGDIRNITPFSLNQDDLKCIADSKKIFNEKIKSLLSSVIEYRDAHSEGRYQSVIVKARDYINRNFNTVDISLYSTASYVGISPNYLSTIFAQETGENFIEYLTRVRIEKAKQLLRDTAMKSIDIAYETGFNDPHYFSSIFKKNTGYSPREFRLSEKNITNFVKN